MSVTRVCIIDEFVSGECVESIHVRKERRKIHVKKGLGIEVPSSHASIRDTPSLHAWNRSVGERCSNRSIFEGCIQSMHVKKVFGIDACDDGAGN